MKRKLGSILILLGIVIVIYAGYTKIQTITQQNKLAEEFKSLNFTDEASEGTQNTSDQTPLQNGDVIGMLEIPAIELESPVLEGASQENIKYAVGHLPSSSPVNTLGEKDHNFAIAGHRTYTYGQFFNRLDELKEGNEIILTTKEKKYTYKVFETKIVKPTDVDVIYPIKGKSVITLITCHPKNSNKKRLIVYGELVSQ